MERWWIMSQSQEFISRKNSLKKTEQVNRPDENLELSANNNNSRMRRELMEEAAYTAYDSVAVSYTHLTLPTIGG